MASSLWLRNHSLLHLDSWTSLSLASCFSNCLSGEVARRWKTSCYWCVHMHSRSSQGANCRSDEHSVIGYGAGLPAWEASLVSLGWRWFSVDVAWNEGSFEVRKVVASFCKKYGKKNRCPKAYFSGFEENDGDFANGSVFIADEETIKVRLDL